MSIERLHVIITGIGLSGPLADGAWPTFRALLDGAGIGDRAANAAGIDPIDLARTVGGASVPVAAGIDPAVELAVRAAREALGDAASDTAGPTHAGGEPVTEPACVLGAGKGAVHALCRALSRDLPAAQRRLVLREDGESQPPADALNAVALGPHAYLAHHLQRRLRLGDVRTIVASCVSGLAAIDVARRWLLHGSGGSRPQRCLVVSAEAALLPAFIHSYRRLGVLAPLKPGSYRASPLDESRGGFVPCEIAAAVLLEAAHDPLEGRIALVDSAVATQPASLVQPAPRPDVLAAMARRLTAGRHLDVLHPHATGTRGNDPRELRAYVDALRAGPRPAPSLYAVKGALGHGLGASGLVSLVIACLCARSGRRPPMPWLARPLRIQGLEARIRPEAGRLNAEDGTHAIFATGFGGSVAGAVIQRH